MNDIVHREKVVLAHFSMFYRSTRLHVVPILHDVVLSSLDSSPSICLELLPENLPTERIFLLLESFDIIQARGCRVLRLGLLILRGQSNKWNFPLLFGMSPDTMIFLRMGTFLIIEAMLASRLRFVGISLVFLDLFVMLTTVPTILVSHIFLQLLNCIEIVLTRDTICAI